MANLDKKIYQIHAQAGGSALCNTALDQVDLRSIPKVPTRACDVAAPQLKLPDSDSDPVQLSLNTSCKVKGLN